MISPNILIGLKLLMVVACGGAIGLERELSRKPAGLRTNVLVCVGAALFMIVSRHIGGGAPYTDPARLVAQVVTAIGFIGAGVILQSRGSITGLTTAATILMVGKEAVLAAVGDSAVCTINARSGEQHAGSGGNTYGRPGRIAKSVNVPAASLIDPQNGAFLPPPALRAKFAAAGAFDKKQVITYCGGGIAASADALALVMLGHPDVRLYDASMSEWANDPSLPMETG